MDDVERARRQRDEARSWRLASEKNERIASENVDHLSAEAQLAERQARETGKSRHEAGALWMRRQHQDAARAHKYTERDLQRAQDDERRAQQQLDAAERDAARAEREPEEERER